MKNHKILSYLVICFLFFISCSDCQPMEVLGEESSSESSSHSDSETSGSHSKEEDNGVYKTSEAADLLAHVQLEDSQKSTRATKLAAVFVAVPAVIGAVVVMAPFANLTGYLFHDGIRPVIDNSTCHDNVTHNPPLFDQNSTDIFLDTLYTGGLALVPAVTGVVSASFGGGGWLLDKARSVKKAVRNCFWSDQEASQKRADNPTVQLRGKAEEKKGCLPKRFKNLNYYLYSWPVEVVNGLFWGEFYFNFIATTVIVNYPNDPLWGQAWGYLFASVAVPFVYRLYTHVTGEASKRSFHRQGNQDNAQGFVLTLLEMMEQMEQGKILNQEVNAFRIIMRPYIASEEELRNAWNCILPNIPDNLLETVKATERTKTKYTRNASFAIQGVQSLFKIWAQYMLIHKFCWALGASPDLAREIAAPVTAFLAPFLGFGSLREQSLIQYELHQIPEYFSWPRSGYTVATRTGSILAAAANIFYWATPSWYAYQREILYDIYCHQYLISDLRVRAPLAAIFSITPWAVGRQFFECQFNRIIDLVASMSCCAGGDLEENSEVLTEKEKKDLRRILQRASYLLRKSQYILEKKSYELDETTVLTQYRA